jgi:hypothetical protein
MTPLQRELFPRRAGRRQSTVVAALSHFHANDFLEKVREWAGRPSTFDSYDVYLSCRPSIRASLDASPNTVGGLMLAAK